MSRPVPDLAQRRAALDPLRSFIVQAPAGSGKTELLIQRFLALLGRVDRPEEICALTFTRKAAAQMRNRIFEALRVARHGPRPAEEHKAGTWELARAALARNDASGWKLEESASRLRVQTIDALCASLTRQMPVVSQFGAQPESVDDATALYAEAARNTLAALESEEDPASGHVQRVLAHLDNNAVLLESLLAGMLRRRDHWIRTLTSADDRVALEGTLAALGVEAVRRAQALFPPVPGMAPLPPPDDVQAWRQLSRELLTQGGEWRKKHAVAQALAGEDALCAALFALQSLPEPRYDEGQWEALGAITRLLPRAVAELKLVFAAHGQADFVEITQGALRALGGEEGPSDLMLALDYRIRHILVDEFQDTSFTQRDLLRQLTAGWEPQDGRTLFVVGDPMQSIYRFREAEVALFLEAQHRGIGGVRLEPLTLGANFRSQAGIVDWVNEAFVRVMPAREDIATGAVRYSPSAAVHAREREAVVVHPFFGGDLEGEAREVARLAAAALAHGESSTAAILVRNRSHLDAIAPRLRSEGLRFRAIEIEALGHRPVVQDLLALTRALSHLADRTAWLSVLRAPWTGLVLADLAALAAASASRTPWEAMHDPQALAGLSGEGRARVEAARESLAPFVECHGRRGLRDRVEGAWLALRGPACVQDRTDLEDAQIYLEHLEDAESAGGIMDPAAFEAEVAALYALPDVAASDRLQVMTIHKAKGLEFDTVIVPGLGAGTGRDERPLFMWLETIAGLLLAPINPTGGDKDPIYEFIRRLDREKSDHECGRLLYVAATRARRRLHLLGDCNRDAAGIRPPARGSLLDKLWPAVAHHFTQAVPDDSPQLALPLARSRADVHLRLAHPVPVRAPAAVDWKSREAPRHLREAIEFSWVGETARHVGSVVHRWLQRIAEDELRGWDAKRIRALEPAIARELAARGVPAAEMATASARAVSALAGSVADERGRWLLGPQRDARNELRLSAMLEGECVHLAIDRMFVDAEGRAWIVDYKTSSHEGADTPRFLDREQQRYARQLERYAGAAMATGEGMLGLYFPLLKGWRAWPARRLPSEEAEASDAHASL